MILSKLDKLLVHNKSAVQMFITGSLTIYIYFSFETSINSLNITPLPNVKPQLNIGTLNKLVSKKSK